MTPEEKTKLLQDTIADIQNGVLDNVKALENRVAELVATGANPVGLRQQIMSAFEQYRAGGESVAREVRGIADTQLQDIEVDDIETSVALLGEQSAAVVGGSFASAAENVIQTVVLGTVAGIATDQLVRQVRGRISGVFMESEDAQVRRQQRTLARLLDAPDANPKEIQTATRLIRERLTGVNTTASLRDLTAKSVESAVMQFDGAFTKAQADKRGIKRYRYDGGLVNESREWCQQMEGTTLTEDEIYELWDSSDWAGKEPGDPFVVRGGYNCRHFWVPIDDE